MPAYDRFHNAVRTALVKDGWVITDDPLTVRVGERKLFVDLGAEQVIGAAKGARKIAVEIKSFTGLSQMPALHEALGQFVLYREALAEKDPERELYLAVPQAVPEGIFQENSVGWCGVRLTASLAMILNGRRLPNEFPRTRSRFD